MTDRTAATRYARALLDVAVKEQADLSQIEAQLTGFGQLLEQHEDLAKALLNPAVPTPRKRTVVQEILSRTEVHPILGKLLLMLAERDRLTMLPDLITAYRERLLEYQKVLRAEVTTAIPLAPERARVIEQGLMQATGRDVTLTTRVDPSLIGGMVARIGSTVYDGSITNHLQRMRQRLEQGVQ